MSKTVLDKFLRKIAGDPQFRVAAPSGEAYEFVSPPEDPRQRCHRHGQSPSTPTGKLITPSAILLPRHLSHLIRDLRPVCSCIVFDGSLRWPRYPLILCQGRQRRPFKSTLFSCL